MNSAKEKILEDAIYTAIENEKKKNIYKLTCVILASVLAVLLCRHRR